MDIHVQYKWLKTGAQGLAMLIEGRWESKYGMHLQLKVNTNQLFYRVVFPIALVGLAVAFVLLLNALFHQPPRKAVKGVLDLQGWAFEKQPALLAGEWAFYWNDYLSPDALADRDIQRASGYLNFPGVWNGLEYQGKPLPLMGHGTVSLRVLLTSGDPFWLKVPILTNRYQLWINGELVAHDDLLEPRAQHSEATQSRLFAVLPVHGADAGYEVQLVFQLLNDRHRAGGIWEPLHLTKQVYQDDILKWPKAFDALMAFLLSCASLVILVLGFRERRWPYLWLALFAAFMSVRAGTINERLFFELFSITDWELQQAIEHTVLFAALSFFALYSGFRFPSYFPASLHRFVVCVYGVLIALVLITPPSVFAHTILLFELVTAIYIFVWIGALLEHLKESRAAKLLFLGGMFCVVCGVNDMLYTLNFIDSTNLFHVGALGFISASYFYRGELIKQGSLLEAVAFSQTQTFDQDDTHPLARDYNNFRQQGDDNSLRALTVSALNYALNQWESKKVDDKIAFAQTSGLWRVTNDSGTLKTRTLDKYLKTDTLPQNPRYKTVGKSLEYVANMEEVEAADREWLIRVAGIYDNL